MTKPKDEGDRGDLDRDALDGAIDDLLRRDAGEGNDPHPGDAEIAAYAAGTLPEREREEIVRHLAHCDPCRVVAAEVAAVVRDRAGGDPGPAPAPPPVQWGGVRRVARYLPYAAAAAVFVLVVISQWSAPRDGAAPPAWTVALEVGDVTGAARALAALDPALRFERRAAGPRETWRGGPRDPFSLEAPAGPTLAADGRPVFRWTKQATGDAVATAIRVRWLDGQTSIPIPPAGRGGGGVAYPESAAALPRATPTSAAAAPIQWAIEYERAGRYRTTAWRTFTLASEAVLAAVAAVETALDARVRSAGVSAEAAADLRRLVLANALECHGLRRDAARELAAITTPDETIRRRLAALRD